MDGEEIVVVFRGPTIVVGAKNGKVPHFGPFEPFTEEFKIIGFRRPQI
jgi:hypothetical protein